MNEYETQVLTAFSAIKLRSLSRYSWFGKLSPKLPATKERPLDASLARRFLIHNLEGQLYRDFYATGTATPAGQAPEPEKTTRLTPFVQALSQANCGTGYWEEGWTLRAFEADTRIVERDGLTLRASLEDCILPADSVDLAEASVSLRMPSEFFNLSPGFYMANGANDLGRGPVIRLYWNSTPVGAVGLMQGLTSELNAAGTPFRLKALNDPERYRRCDAVVLFVRRDDYPDVAVIVRRIHAEVEADLKSATPALTKKLAYGLSLAEDPGDQVSFGQHRCYVLAEGILRALEQGVDEPEEQLRLIRDRFAVENISLDCPYLNLGSSDSYVPLELMP